MEERKIITMAELEEIMTARTGVFGASSIDSYSFSVDLVCTGVHFDKVMDSGKYLCMILIVNGSEIDIDPEIIEEIYIDKDETITMEFNNGLPDLEIKYRN